MARAFGLQPPAAISLEPAESLHRIFDHGQRETRFFTALAVFLVVVRAAVLVVAGSVSFDSEQAIIGLMAKHLSEFRRFPFFTYGQNYQLAVEAWIIAPFFWLMRPSVLAMRIPLLILNAVVAVMLMRMLSGELRLRPALGFLAALPFIMPTPIVAITLMENTGAAVEPFLYVLVLWILRRRPVAFGALLAFGWLHREFTLYALPALAVVCAFDRSSWTAAGIRWPIRMISGFALVWILLDYVRLHVENASLFMQAQMFGGTACFQSAEIPMRARSLFVSTLPALVGGNTVPLYDYAKRSPAVVGSPIVGWIVGTAMVVILLRLAWLWMSSAERPAAGVGVYLTCTGLCAVAAYPLACSTGVPYPIFRYLTLAALLPIGLLATFLACERSPLVRAAIAGGFIVWGTANLIDNVKVLQPAFVSPDRDPHQELADFLLSHKIHYGRASFWDAYAVAFLSNERIIVASNTISRIPEYERLVHEHDDAAVGIVRLPCDGHLRVSAWCIQVPAR